MSEPQIKIDGRGVAVDNYMVGRTKSASLIYVREHDNGRRLLKVEDEVVVRDWDVTDAHARNVAAGKILKGALLPRPWAQWWIDPERNAAALTVYRHSPTSAIDRLNDLCSDRGVSWALFFDHDRVLREELYEVRVYGEGRFA